MVKYYFLSCQGYFPIQIYKMRTRWGQGSDPSRYAYSSSARHRALSERGPDAGTATSRTPLLRFRTWGSLLSAHFRTISHRIRTQGAHLSHTTAHFRSGPAHWGRYFPHAIAHFRTGPAPGDHHLPHTTAHFRTGSAH